MRTKTDVKDKNIRLENLKYRAQVYFYDGRVVDCGLFDSLPPAQKELAKFPRDVWDGYSSLDYRYREPDTFFRGGKTHGIKSGKFRRKFNIQAILSGRSLVDRICLKGVSSE